MPHSKNRNIRILTFAAYILSLSCLSWNARAQNSSTENVAVDQPSLRIESNLVVLRVVVRDPAGNAATGLKKDDFRLFDQGKEQAISQFEEEPRSNPANAQRLRFIAFYFDNLNSTDAELMQARDRADRYLANSLQPNDRVALFSAEKVLSDFTTDPGKIHEALMQLRVGSAGEPGQTQCPAISDYQALQLVKDDDTESEAWRAAWEEGKACPVKAFSSNVSGDAPDRTFIVAIRMRAQTIVNQSQDRARIALQQFEKVVDFISRAPGDRSVLMVSPGFLSQNEQRSTDRIIDHALHAGVIINSLNPKGLAGLMSVSGSTQGSAPSASPRAMQSKSSIARSGELSNAEVLSELAQGTGGLYFHNDNDLRAGFKALEEDTPHYILAFSPRNVRLDDKFHPLKVSLAEKRKGYVIQARRGYFAIPDRGAKDELAADPKKATDAAPPQPPVKPQVPDTTTTGNISVQQPSVPAVRNAIVAGDIAKSADLRLHRGINRLTVNQLQTFISAAGGRADTDLAKQLDDMELTERVGLPQITRMESALPGDRSRLALSMLTDTSAFLKQPASDAPLPPAPKVEEQIQWLKAAANFVVNTMSKLPNFLATRSATTFADSPSRRQNGVFYANEPMHSIHQSKATVLFRDGKEILEEEDKGKDSEMPVMGLKTSGEFGPLLGTVVADASRSSLSWSHWERGDEGPVAVYRYVVPRAKSHYQVEFCCIGGSTSGYFRQVPGYHGEISVDPSNGAIVRITLLADLQSAYPMFRADMMIEYGPVEIGEKKYPAPLHSVSIAKAYTTPPSNGPQTNTTLNSLNNRNEWPQQTMINDVRFEDYHVFRSDSRILPTDDQPPQ